MRAFASVGVHDDLASCETCVPVRAAYHELARWIDEILDIVVEERGRLGVECADDCRYQDRAHVVAYRVEHHLVGALLTASRLVGTYKLVMLGRDDDSVDAQRLPFVTVLYRNLAFGVRPQVSHQLTGVAYLIEHGK